MEKQVLDMIQSLADKLGTTSETIFGYMVLREIVSGYVNTIGGIFTIIVLIGVIVLCWKMDIKKDHDSDGWSIAAVVVSIVGGVLIIMMMFCVADGVTSLFAPHGQALKTLIESATPNND